jgi:molybdopterin synthase sulfur carrier subunit
VKVSVLYFARLKSERGLSFEELETDCASVGDLYAHLVTQHSLQTPASHVKTAVNDEFCSPETRLNNGDVVAFMPPMAGG